MDLTIVAWVSIGVAVICAVGIAVDEMRQPQAMGVMNVVWPVTALYFSVFAVWAYFVVGRKKTRSAMAAMSGMPMGGDKDAPPTLVQVMVGTSHCGAGCMIADVACEFWIAAAGITLLGSPLWASYAIDFVAAWTAGIGFQYWAIWGMRGGPMRKKFSVGGAIWAAIKADTFSIAAFQVGMYAWMALVYFKLFHAPHLMAFDPRYWLMMQIAMVCGFATSFPMNRLLMVMGVKEKM